MSHGDTTPVPDDKNTLTLGHVLFQRWLNETYSKAPDETRRSVFGCLKSFAPDFNKRLPKHRRLNHVRSMYLWLPPKGKRTQLRRPEEDRASALALLSQDAVPVDAWSQPPEVDDG